MERNCQRCGIVGRNWSVGDGRSSSGKLFILDVDSGDGSYNNGWRKDG